ncbi:DNA-directed RNA polymerase sigma-70 factor [Bacteroidia bacterium]|nr:DNA-directed RNA polymerase sigma-70 factor [Bacteroidia bacterium]
MDAATFKNMFLPTSRKLYVVAFRLLENREDAEDAVQETFAKLWAKRADLSQIANSEAFAVVVLRNVCLDVLKSKKMEFTDFDENMSESQHFFAAMETHDKILIIRKLIENLPNVQRKIMKLKYWDDFSDNEIALATGIGTGNIRVQLSRARKTVRERFLKIEQ